MYDQIVLEVIINPDIPIYTAASEYDLNDGVFCSIISHDFFSIVFTVSSSAAYKSACFGRNFVSTIFDIVNLRCFDPVKIVEVLMLIESVFLG